MKITMNNLLKILMIILIALGFIILFNQLSNFIFSFFSIIIPFLIGFTIGFIVDPWIKYLKKKNLSHNISVSIVIIFLVSLIVVFCIFLVPLINKELTFFIDNFPEFIEKLNDLFNNIPIMKKMGIEFKTVLEYIFVSNNKFMSKIFNFVIAIFSSFIPIITTPILIIYFIIYYEKIEIFIKEKLIKKEDLYNIFKEIKHALHNYFKSYFLITILLSSISAFAFAILKIDYFLIWGIIIGITNIIPYVGPYIGGGIVGLYVLTTTPNLLIYVVIIIVCLQIIESNFLTPKIQGDKLQINPILVVFSVAFFGKILGIFGMIIAVPIIQIIQIVVNAKKILKKR